MFLIEKLGLSQRGGYRANRKGSVDNGGASLQQKYQKSVLQRGREISKKGDVHVMSTWLGDVHVGVFMLGFGQ